MIALLLLAAVAALQPIRQQFDIPPGTLREQLAAWSHETDAAYCWNPDDLNQLRPALHGLYTVDEALYFILGGLEEGWAHSQTSPLDCSGCSLVNCGPLGGEAPNLPIYVVSDQSWRFDIPAATLAYQLHVWSQKMRVSLLIPDVDAPPFNQPRNAYRNTVLDLYAALTQLLDSTGLLWERIGNGPMVRLLPLDLSCPRQPRNFDIPREDVRYAFVHWYDQAARPWSYVGGHLSPRLAGPVKGRMTSIQAFQKLAATADLVVSEHHHPCLIVVHDNLLPAPELTAMPTVEVKSPIATVAVLSPPRKKPPRSLPLPDTESPAPPSSDTPQKLPDIWGEPLFPDAPVSPHRPQKHST